MNNFELSLEEGKPTNIYSFILDLNAAPPKLTGKNLDIAAYIPVNSLVKKVQFKDAVLKDAYLNLYICRFETGKCIVYIFGDFTNGLVKKETEYKIENLRDFDLLIEKIKFILSKSKNILKSYYTSGKIKNIEHHILAFLTDNVTG